MAYGDQRCRVYWGGHGCELPRGHPGTTHVCAGDGEGDLGGLCSMSDGEQARYAEQGGTWSPWLLCEAFGDDL